MDCKEQRKMRMQELKQKNKDRIKEENSLMSQEEIKALLPNVEILSDIESKQIYHRMQDAFPFVWWGRIDWDIVKEKLAIKDKADIISEIQNRVGFKKISVYVLWGYGDYPVILMGLQEALNYIEEINAIGCDQWLYCPSHNFIIEFYHDGDMTIGFRSR